MENIFYSKIFGFFANPVTSHGIHASDHRFSGLFEQIWGPRKFSTPRCFTFFRRSQTLRGFVSSVALCFLELLMKDLGSGFLKKVVFIFLRAKIQPPLTHGGGSLATRCGSSTRQPRWGLFKKSWDSHREVGGWGAP